MGGATGGIAPWEWLALPVAATHMAYNGAKMGYDYATGAQPNLPKPPAAPDPASDAVRNAKLMERRKQLGLQGRMSTFLTTAQGTDSQPKPGGTLLTSTLGG